MPPDVPALRFLIDSVLAANDGRALDDAEDRDAVALTLVEVLFEYLRPRGEAAEQ